MSDRVEYIRRRLDELEAAAKAAGESRIAWLTYRDEDGAMLYTTVAAEASDGTWLAAGGEVPAPASALTVYDPAAVLARVAADRAILALFAPEPEPGPPETDAQLHARRAHPAYEYDTTEGPRKAWDYEDVPPCGDDGEPDYTWERNIDAGDRGWERFDYTEEAYWRRRLPDDQIRKPAVHPVIRLLAEGLGWTEAASSE